MKIHLVDASTIEGQGIFVKDRQLYLLKQPHIFFNDFLLNEQIEVIDISNIESIYLLDKYNSKKPRNRGAIIGSAIGTSLTGLAFLSGGGFIPPIIIPAGAVAFGFVGGLIGWYLIPSREEFLVYQQSISTQDLHQLLPAMMIFPDSLPDSMKISSGGSIEIKPVDEADHLLNAMLVSSPMMKKVFYTPKIAVSGNIGATLFMDDVSGFVDYLAGLGLVYAINERFYGEYNYNYKEFDIGIEFSRVLEHGYLFNQEFRRSVKKKSCFLPAL